MEARHARICALAREGYNMGEIARMCPCGYNTVKRTLKRYGVTSTLRTRRNIAQHPMLAFNDGLALKARGSKHAAFDQQRKAAKRRGIEWQMSFPEWRKVWLDSGRWELRGVGADRYCMARYGDVGPYSVANVRIILFGDNIREARALDWARRNAAKAQPAQSSLCNVMPSGSSIRVVSHGKQFCPREPRNATQLLGGGLRT